jgi:hypothetical protein
MPNLSTMYVNNIAPRDAAAVLFPNKPAFLAGRTDGNYTSVVGKFQLNTTKYNVGNVWNTTSYEFTAPIDGMYFFYGQIYYNSGAINPRCQIRKNDNENLVTAQRTITASDNTNTISIMHRCVAGDRIYLYSDQNNSQTHYYGLNDPTYGPHTYFMGYLIG